MNLIKKYKIQMSFIFKIIDSLSRLFSARGDSELSHNTANLNDSEKLSFEIDNNKIIVEKARQFHRFIDDSILTPNGNDELKDLNRLFTYTTSIQLKEGLKLCLTHQEPIRLCYPSDCLRNFYFYHPIGTKILFPHVRHDSVIFVDDKILTVDFTEMGIWEMFLFVTAPTMMPIKWNHKEYLRCRYFILDEADVNNICPLGGMAPIPYFDYSALNAAGMLYPKIEMQDISADISYCYLDFFRGLVREKITFTRFGDAVAIFPPETLTIFRYNCGWYF